MIQCLLVQQLLLVLPLPLRLHGPIFTSSPNTPPLAFMLGHPALALTAHVLPSKAAATCAACILWHRGPHILTDKPDGTRLAALHAEAASLHITRRLTATNVQPGDDLVSAVANAASGSEIVLADGTYNLASTISIGKDITIRAKNTGMAVLDGQTSVRVLHISSGNVQLIGVNVTRGSTSDNVSVVITNHL